MTNETATDDPSTIDDRITRVETIIEQLERGELSIAEAKAQYEEARGELQKLRDELEVGEGRVTEETPTE